MKTLRLLSILCLVVPCFACVGMAVGAEIPEFATVPAPGKSVEEAEPRMVRLDLAAKTEKKNQITDDEAWWERNQLESPFLSVPNSFSGQAGDLPEVMPAQLPNGRRVVTASLSGDQPFAIYGADYAQGDQVLLFDKELGRITHALDFSPWITGRYRVQWLQVVDDTLYLSYGINGYAKEVGGKTGYIAAYELTELKLIWQSEPLVANSRNFLVVDDSVISGYGFTDEDDYLYVINRFTGEILQSEKVASGPDFLIRKDDRLFVRCYNRDYVFPLIIPQ